MGRRRTKGRPVDGIVLLDKPAGWTSNQALQKVKWLFNARKAGHTGTLDPLATGMLPICLGEATKISSFLLDSDKVYVAGARLGITTTTADAEGEVLQRCRVPADLDQARLAAVLPAFRGEIQQIPPMYSALKVDGQRLHKLARAGKQVERKARNVVINTLTLLEYSNEQASFRVSCSKGTYIRSLVEDIGQALGCGAHVVSLRRESVGSFAEYPMVSLATLERLAEPAAGQSDTDERDFSAFDQHIVPMENALTHLQRVTLGNAADISRFCHGQAVPWSGAPSAQTDLVRVGSDTRFLGLGRIDGHKLAPVKVFVTGEP